LSEKEATIIIALGNPLRGDDGIGQAVLAALKNCADLPEHVSCIDGGTAGLETILLWNDFPHAILIDAAEMGRKPGEWVRFVPAEVTLGGVDFHSIGAVHSAGLAHALELSDALGQTPAEVVIFGIQPGEIGWEPGLTSAVTDVIPAICNEIIRELKD